MTRGAGIVVAVLDTGVDRTHPALVGRLLPGYDFVGMDGNPSEVGVSGQDLSYGHGTPVAGLVALAAPEASILPVRVLDRDGAGNIWVLAEALAYAVDPDRDIDTPDGAHVINLSLSTLRATSLTEEFVRDVICEDDDDDDGDGDGDDGDGDGDGDGAEDDDDHCLASAAHTEDDRLAAFSNRGAWVQVAAPGDRILSSVPGGDYGTWSGTSMAAPLVAGQAGLIRAAHPTWTPTQVAERIGTTATSGPNGEPPRVDAAAALGLAPTERTNLPGNGNAPAPRLFLPTVHR